MAEMIKEELVDKASKYINRQLAEKKSIGWLKAFVEMREIEDGKHNQERGSRGLSAGVLVRKNYGV